MEYKQQLKKKKKKKNVLRYDAMLIYVIPCWITHPTPGVPKFATRMYIEIAFLLLG